MNKKQQIEWLRDELEASQTRVLVLQNEKNKLTKQLAERDASIDAIRKIVGSAVNIYGGGGGGGMTYTFPSANPYILRNNNDQSNDK